MDNAKPVHYSYDTATRKYIAPSTETNIQTSNLYYDENTKTDNIKPTGYGNKITTEEYNTYLYTPYAVDETMTTTQPYDKYTNMDNTKSVSYGSKIPPTKEHSSNEKKTISTYSKITKTDGKLNSIKYEADTKEHKHLDHPTKYVEVGYVPKSITYSTIKSKFNPELLYLVTTPYRAEESKEKSNDISYHHTTVNSIKNINTDESLLGFKTFYNDIFTSNQHAMDPYQHIEEKTNSEFTYEKESSVDASNKHKKSGIKYNDNFAPEIIPYDYSMEDNQENNYYD